MARILIIEDDKIMAECIARAITKAMSVEISYFSNVVEAVQSLNEALPDLICLDILLDGPDGFSLLNELNSYADTAQIPILIITSLNLQAQNLRHYNVQKVLQKETMTPLEIGETVQEILVTQELNCEANQDAQAISKTQKLSYKKADHA